MTSRRSRRARQKHDLGAESGATALLIKFALQVRRQGWRLARLLLSTLPGGRGLINRVITLRMLSIERAARAKRTDLLQSRFFGDRDLTAAELDDVTALVAEVVESDQADARMIADVITEIGYASGLSVKALYRRYQRDMLEAFFLSAKQLTLPSSQAPKVSVILVLHNNAELTLACLKALQKEQETAIEIIIVDNASSDRTGALLEAVRGAQIIRNGGNIGFVLAVNQASKLARGDHILLLNNDAVMRSGALEHAVRQLESDPLIGAVGARIVLIDASLQEAGSIIWNDGTCQGYARGDEPDAPHAMFVREVDFCSGAFLLTRTDIWRELGGFDPAFAPAYYEETDYCMRLRARGYRVVYEPRAVIDHFEFGSADNDGSAISQQQKNRAVFEARHQEALSHQLAPSAANTRRARSRCQADALRVLMIDDRIPHRRLGSGYPRAADLIQTLTAAGHEVTFYPLQIPFEPWEAVYDAVPRTVEVVNGSGVAGFDDYLIQNILDFDVVIVSRPLNMMLFNAVHEKAPELFSTVRIVYDAEALFAHREIMKAEVAGKPLPAGRANTLINQEVALSASADVVAAVCETEAEQFRKAVSAPVVVLGHRIEPRAGEASFAERSDLLFVGALNDEDSPNVDSITWFAQDILPLVNETLDRMITLHLAGAVAPKVIERLSSCHLAFHGEVDDLTQFYNQSRIFVAPTRYAAGVPRKIHEAAAHGLPCVSTRLIARQLGWIHGEALLADDDAEAIAQHVVRLYQDAELWKRIRAGALQKVEADCAPDTFDAAVSHLLRP